MTKSRQKVAKRFLCESCDYSTRNKFDWNKHLATTKHQNGNNGNKNGNKMGNMVLKFTCQNCYQQYKFRSGLSRHQKKCKTDGAEILEKKSPNVANVGLLHDGNDTAADFVKCLRGQQELLTRLVEQQESLIPKIGNNNNNKISINIFLNEKCKNAMNLTDFLEQVQVSLTDLKYTNEHGYVEGISNILTKHLTDMKVTERPIHCSDKKRLQFYVKEDDAWSKDKEHMKMDHTIKYLEKKQILQIKEWEKQNPDYLDDDKVNTEWHQMIYNMMGGPIKNTTDKTHRLIKESVSKNILVKDSIDI